MPSDNQPLTSNEVRKLDNLLPTRIALGFARREKMADACGIGRDRYAMAEGSKSAGPAATRKTFEEIVKKVNELVLDKPEAKEIWNQQNHKVCLDTLLEVSLDSMSQLATIIKTASPVKDVWDEAQRMIDEDWEGSYHVYCELASLIGPKTWQSEQWKVYQRQLLQRTSVSRSDHAHRLHILDAKHLPQVIARKKLRTTHYEQWTKATESNNKDQDEAIRLENFCQLQALVLAEYLSGIRSRVLFIFEDEIKENKHHWQKHLLFDGGLFFQSPRTYKVLLTDILPLAESTENFNAYIFHEENAPYVYWALRANFYKLYRTRSDQLFKVFDLFPTAASVDEVRKEDIEKFTSVDHLPSDWFENLRLKLKNYLVPGKVTVSAESMFKAGLKVVQRPTVQNKA